MKSKNKIRPFLAADAIMILLANLSWGLGYIVARAGIDYFTADIFLALKFSFMALLFLPFYPKKPAAIDRIFLLAFFNAAYHFLLFRGIATLDVSTSVITAHLSVPFTSILGALILRERLRFNHLLGIAFTFLGIIVIFGNPNVKDNIGAFLTLVASSFCLGVVNILMKQHKEASPMALITWQSVFIALMAWLIVFYGDVPLSMQFFTDSTLEAKLAIIYVVIIATFFAHNMFYQIMSKYSVHRVVSFSVLTPIFGIVAARFVLNETLSWQIIIGTIVALFGVIVSSSQSIGNKLNALPRNLIDHK